MAFDELDHSQFVTRHQTAADKMRAEGRSDIADLHDKLVNAVAAKDAKAQVNVGKAVAALAEKDAIGFLSNGFAFENQQGSGKYTYLIECGAPVSALASKDPDALGHAILRDEPEMVALLLDKGASAKKVYQRQSAPALHGHSPLTLAMSRAEPNEVIVARLLGAGELEVNQPSPEGLTPAAYAIRANRLDWLQAVLKRKPNLNRVIFPPYAGEGAKDVSALDVAIKNAADIGNEGIELLLAALLVDGGVDPKDWKDELYERSLREWAEAEDWHLVTALAAKKAGDKVGFEKAVAEFVSDRFVSEPELRDADRLGMQMLRRAGLKPNAKIEHGQTFIYRLIDASAPDEAFEFALDWGSDPNDVSYDKGPPLHFAVRENRPELVKRLIAAGAKRTLKDRDGKVAADFMNGDTDDDIRELLVGNGSRPNPAP